MMLINYTFSMNVFIKRKLNDRFKNYNHHTSSALYDKQ